MCTQTSRVALFYIFRIFARENDEAGGRLDPAFEMSNILMSLCKCINEMSFLIETQNKLVTL